MDDVSVARMMFECLSQSRKAEVLAWIMHELTVEARETYEVGSEEIANGPQLRRINELQHKLSAQVAKYVSDDRDRIPDEAVIAMIYDFGARGRRAFRRVIEHDYSSP